MLPAEFCEMFSCDMDSDGLHDFLELTHRIAAEWRGADERKPCCSGIVTMMCKQRGLWSRPFYSRMRRAVRPILEADDETLSALGIVLKKRTSSALAYALAGVYLSGE